MALWLLGLAVVTAGCNQPKETHTQAPLSTTPDRRPGGSGPPRDITEQLPGGKQFAAGKKVYSDHNCARCHKLGETGNATSMAPDLSQVAAKPDHTKQWLGEHVRNAKAHNPRSRMPDFGPDKISDADLDALTNYLASLK